MTTFIVRATSTEYLAYEIDAADAEDARERYMFDGVEIEEFGDMSYGDMEVTDVTEGTAADLLNGVIS